MAVDPKVDVCPGVAKPLAPVVLLPALPNKLDPVVAPKPENAAVWAKGKSSKAASKMKVVWLRHTGTGG